MSRACKQPLLWCFLLFLTGKVTVLFAEPASIEVQAPDEVKSRSEQAFALRDQGDKGRYECRKLIEKLFSEVWKSCGQQPEGLPKALKVVQELWGEGLDVQEPLKWYEVLGDKEAALRILLSERVKSNDAASARKAMVSQLDLSVAWLTELQAVRREIVEVIEKEPRLPMPALRSVKLIHNGMDPAEVKDPEERAVYEKWWRQQRLIKARESAVARIDVARNSTLPMFKALVSAYRDAKLLSDTEAAAWLRKVE